MTQTKGIILSSGEGRAVILTPAGEYRSIKIHAPLEVGELYDDGASRPWWRYALAAAVILAMTLGTIDFYSVKAYAQLSDSMELGVNRWGRVITTRALSNEGAEILQETNLKGKKIGAAVEQIVNQAIAEGDLEQYEKYKEFPIQAIENSNKDPEFIKRVQDNMNQGLVKAIENGKKYFPDQSRDVENIDMESADNVGINQNQAPQNDPEKSNQGLNKEDDPNKQNNKGGNSN